MESKLQREKIKEYVEKTDPAKKKKGKLGALFVTKQLQASLVGQQIKEESEKMDSLSMAFAKIQNSTGLSDVNEIVQKFLTRDETYESLCKSAESARQQIDDLRNEQVELNTKLAELQSGGVSVGNRDYLRASVLICVAYSLLVLMFEYLLLLSASRHVLHPLHLSKQLVQTQSLASYP